MRRREFLKQAGAAALATASVAATPGSGPFVHASDKAGRKNPVIGKGEHRYECVHGWGEVPGSIHWHETHGVAVDKAGFIYIKHRADDQKPKSPEDAQDTIDGFKIRTQPDRWPAGKFIHPHDACFDKDGNIFVAEWVQTGRVSLLRHVS